MQQYNMLEHALHYASIGWLVFPVNKYKKPLTEHGKDDATTDTEQITAWWKAHPGSGIAVKTGIESGIVVLDIDNKDSKNGFESLNTFLTNRKIQLNTPVLSITGGGGNHIFYKYPDDLPWIDNDDHSKGKQEISSTTKFLKLTGVDTRGEGGYIVLPPSLHPSNNRYQWGENQSPFDNDLPICPDFIKEKQKSQGVNLSEDIADGQRNDTLTRIGGMLRAMGADRDLIFTSLLKHNDDHCKPPLAIEEIEIIAESVSRYEPRNTRYTPEQINLRELLQFNHTDSGAAELLNFCYKNRIRFNHLTGQWLIWTGSTWKIDATDETTQLVIDTARSLYSAAQFEDVEETQAAIHKRARQMENARNIQNTLSVAKTLPSISTNGYEWNSQPYLIGVANGVVNLMTGELRDGTPDDLLSMTTDTPYVQDASFDRWKLFLNEIFAYDQSIINFIQRAIGYSLTGSTVEQSLFICEGNGANGKSIFLDSIRKAFGDYAYTAPFSTFERSINNSQQSNDIAALVNKRFVMASETNEGTSINEARIKSLTSGEKISARFLHQEFFQFSPVCKIWLGVNHLPKVRDDSNGFWRRVKKINFPVSFTESTADKTLGDKLANELPGILLWAIQGAMLWYKEGLQVPETINQSVVEYRNESDPLLDFINQRMDLGETYTVRIDETYKDYTYWCNEKQLKPYERIASDRFHHRMKRDYKLTLDESGFKVYNGIRLKSIIKPTTIISINKTEREAVKYVS